MYDLNKLKSASVACRAAGDDSIADIIDSAVAEIQRLQAGLEEAHNRIAWCAAPGRMAVMHYSNLAAGFEAEIRAILEGKHGGGD